MNYKLEKFWNVHSSYNYIILNKWTINLKSFEIGASLTIKEDGNIWTINLKSFEIDKLDNGYEDEVLMNYKLEKFWNPTPFRFKLFATFNEL